MLLGSKGSWVQRKKGRTVTFTESSLMVKNIHLLVMHPGGHFMLVEEKN